MKKRGQVTLFIIIGVIIALVLILVVYLVSQVEETEAEKEQQTLSQNTMKPLHHYVTRCLDFVVDDALEKISAQGYALYESQGGTIADSTLSIFYDGTKTANRISLSPENIQRGEDGKILVSNSINATEQYGDTTLLVWPWASYPYHPFTGEEVRVGNAAYGWNTLPPLQRSGPNSVEEQIEWYVAENIERCTDWSRFPQFTVTTKNPTVEAIFTTTSTIINMNWKVSITDAQGRTGVQDQYLTARNTRLRSVYEYSKWLIDNDVSNISFSIEQNHSEFLTFVETAENATLIRIVDLQSTLNGEPYEVRFGRENRPPALERINQEPYSQNMNGCTGLLVDFDDASNTFSVIQHSSGCVINEASTVYAQDPDEQNVSFSIQGPKKLPHELTSDDISDPFTPCLGYTIIASDGEREDRQTINLRLRAPTIPCNTN